MPPCRFPVSVGAKSRDFMDLIRVLHDLPCFNVRMRADRLTWRPRIDIHWSMGEMMKNWLI